jgi:hypothetical protein
LIKDFHLLLIILLLIFIRYLIFSLRLVSRPLRGALVLVIISVFLRLLVSALSSKWIRFLIILLFLGGIMVLFVYICRLISRIKIFIKNLYLKGALVLSGGVFLTLILINYLEDYSLHFCTFNLSPIYTKSGLRILLSVASYLIFVLLVSVKLCQKFKGGLKSKFYDPA